MITFTALISPRLAALSAAAPAAQVILPPFSLLILKSRSLSTRPTGLIYRYTLFSRPAGVTLFIKATRDRAGQWSSPPAQCTMSALTLPGAVATIDSSMSSVTSVNDS
ncbi:hypothetical protein PoB_002585800 [Plakobranchus ocellatus]|uniref:Secreted protein n=1 Tax=Plakobranchus ocellatus TaxID=259542 RepID=A0AAV3ZY71_9GAST|nr:hypothetical protein PoB_002585800 [Plakobranchus ocellatus]